MVEPVSPKRGRKSSAHPLRFDVQLCYRSTPCGTSKGNLVSSLENLILDAKQAILDEQHKRFQALQREGRWQEALQQLHVTLSCASDLLNESLGVLERALNRSREQQHRSLPAPPSDQSSS